MLDVIADRCVAYRVVQNKIDFTMHAFILVNNLDQRCNCVYSGHVVRFLSRHICRVALTANRTVLNFLNLLCNTIATK